MTVPIQKINRNPTEQEALDTIRKALEKPSQLDTLITKHAEANKVSRSVASAAVLKTEAGRAAYNADRARELNARADEHIAAVANVDLKTDEGREAYNSALVKRREDAGTVAPKHDTAALDAMIAKHVSTHGVSRAQATKAVLATSEGRAAYAKSVGKVA